MTNELGIFISNDRPVVSSRDIARVFEKEHKNVLRDIQNLKCPESFNALNFEPVTYEDTKGEMRPEYLITRDGFTLLVMGFTGDKAMQWKIKYIEAFNAMERELTIQTALHELPFDIPKTMPEALRLAARLEEERAVLADRLEQDKPYTALGRSLDNTVGETSVGMMATILSQSIGKKISRTKLFGLLERDEILCTTPSEYHRPRQKYIDKGYMNYRVHEISTVKGMKKTFTPYFTPAGRIFIEKHYLEKGTEI